MTCRSLLALGVVLACAVAGLAPAPAVAEPSRAEPDWGSLSYYHYDNTGYYFAVSTHSETWKAQRITGVATGFTPAYPTPDTYAGKQIEAIWSKSCPATKGQKVTLSRTVQIPGKPGQLLLNVQRVSLNGAQHGGKNPVSSVEVRLNGVPVGRLAGKTAGVNAWKSIDMTDHLDVVEDGANTLTLIATKAKTKKKDGFCTNKQPDFGVAAELVGRPVTDLRTTVPPYTAYTFGFQATAEVVNAGPSSTAGAQFNLRTGQEIAANVTSLTLSMPSGDCPTSNTGEGYSASCTLPLLAAGEQITISITMTYTMSCPGNGEIHFTYWAANRWQDPDRANDTRNAGVKCP